MPIGIPGSKTVPKCHPNRRHQGKGLCGPCYMKRYLKSNPAGRRDRRGERFGITPEMYSTKRDQQRKDGDLCGLCKRPLGKERAHLDHNHRTNKLRDFIHRDCNLAIGLLEDDPNLCRLAAEYLEKHGDQNVRV